MEKNMKTDKGKYCDLQSIKKNVNNMKNIINEIVHV